MTHNQRLKLLILASPPRFQTPPPSPAPPLPPLGSQLPSPHSPPYDVFLPPLCAPRLPPPPPRRSVVDDIMMCVHDITNIPRRRRRRRRRCRPPPLDSQLPSLYSPPRAFRPPPCASRLPPPDVMSDVTRHKIVDRSSSHPGAATALSGCSDGIGVYIDRRSTR